MRALLTRKEGIGMLAAFAVAAAAAAATAFAQSPGVPTLGITSPTGNEQIVVTNQGPVIPVVTLKQLRDAGGYCPPTNPASGSTYQIPNNVSACPIIPTATIAALTVALPTTPFDAQRIQFYTPQAITALTVTGPINAATPAPTTLAAGGSIEFVYQLANANWVRVQ